MGKNLAEHRRLTQHKRIQGNKAVIFAEERKAKRFENQKKQQELDQELALQLGLNARKTAEIHYDWRLLSQKLEACFVEVMTKKEHREIGYYGMNLHNN